MIFRSDRRSFLRLLAAGGVGALDCARDGSNERGLANVSPYDGKAADLLLHTERPPNLEMPARWLVHDLTPNEAMFVRWHLSVLPTFVRAGHRVLPPPDERSGGAHPAPAG